MSVKLKWQPNLAFASADASTPATAATNALSQSTCSVTISDPYLTGLAWPALFDAAQLYTQANVAAANNILLPPCEEGQDPYVDKCFKYVDTAVEGEDSSGLGIKNFPFLLVSLWYDVKGTSFGTDFYFRVSGFSVSHGTKYPSVTIRGVEARSVIFNQSLVNMTLDEGVEIEQALKKLAESLGYSVSFCANSNSEPERKRILPRTVRYTGITTGEAIKKVLDSVNGNSLSLPIREYANKISMCTRGEVNQGCSVFYLGKGLYEGYEISGQPELTALALNAEFSSNINNKDPYVSDAFKASTYFISDVTPQKRKKAMEKVKKIAFPGLFEKVPKNVKGAPTATGYVWRDQQAASANTKGIQVINEEATKISKDGLNLFGVAPNGTTSISFLSGDVQEASQADGRILIKTNFSLHICEKEGSKKCFYRPILQESTGLTTVKVKAKDKVEINQEIGTSTSEKKEFVRFYIVGHSGQVTTLNPKIVWDWAFSESEIPKPENPTKASEQTPQQAGGQSEQVVGRVGSTGSSTGPHLHAQWADGRPITADQVREFVKISGTVTSPYGDPARSRHLGVDIGGNDRAPVSIFNGASVASVGETKCTVENVRSDKCGDRFGNNVTINTPKGQMILAHLAPQSIPPNIAGLSTSSGGGKNSPTIQGSPTTSGLTVETSFKGVPRALRIIPGRTILSFITDYDAWVEEGRPASRDPGVWIANRFKNWFVSECEYRWRDGDLRVQIEGVTAWGTIKTTVPTFQNYLKSMRESGDAKISSNYYDYIRSIGGLNWITESGKDSTEERCPEAQALSTFLSQGSDSTSPSDTSTSFPQANCKTGDGTKDSVINALYSAGFNTPNAFAGVLGNFQKESGINFNVHNGASPGAGCGSTPSRVLGTVGYGLAQWCGSRADDLANNYKCGRNCSLQQQLSFLVSELKGYGGMISRMNQAKSAGDAAIIFRREFERPQALDAANRAALAEQVVKQIKCDKPS